jgi:hypothetical protein
MHHLLRNLPVIGTLGVAALFAGPLACLPIEVGAWLLERFDRWLRGRANSSHRPCGRFVARDTDLTCRNRGRGDIRNPDRTLTHRHEAASDQVHIFESEPVCR